MTPILFWITLLSLISLIFCLGYFMNCLERFISVMEYNPADRVPNYEIGVWPQTAARWAQEGMPENILAWDWFVGEDYFNFDIREYIDVNFDMLPPFEYEVLESCDRYELARNPKGIVTRALKEGQVNGCRMSMDEYLDFPVKTRDDFHKLKRRYVAAIPQRYPPDWKTDLLPRWRKREHVLVLGKNCSACGFYWRAREWMGTENLSYAWYDDPDLCHDMMQFYADFTIETAKPILELVDVEYFCLNEDFAMKSGPLLSPETFKKFIYSPMKRLVHFLKSNGVRYVALDSDGNPTMLLPMLMDIGIDILWPLERASGMDPIEIRKKFGKNLRLWGGVDKREIAKGPSAIQNHLLELAPLVEQGGFIPFVDHAVPPDISWENWVYYTDFKMKLIEGRYGC